MIPELVRHPRVVDCCRASPVVVADIGARRESGARWTPHFPAVDLWAFDPDAAECRRIEERFAAQAGGAHRLRAFPVALSDTDGRERLRLTAKPDCSSLFPPNFALLGRYADVERFEVVREELVEVRRLDGLRREQGLPPVDLMKLDVQGAELKVLQGAGTGLADCLALEIEVEFAPLYEGQALFADVDAFVRAAGFTLFDLRPQRWARKCAAPRDPYAGGRQLVWGDAVYLRDPVDAEGRIQGLRRPPADLVKLSLIAAHYGHDDFAWELLAAAARQWGGEAPWLQECAELAAAAVKAQASPAPAARSLWSSAKRALRKVLSTEP